MKTYKKVAYSILFAFIVFFASLYLKFIPCQTAPVIPSPQYTWQLCSLNPDSNLLLGVSTKYLSYTSSIRTTYLIVMAISFILAFLVLSIATQHKHKQ